MWMRRARCTVAAVRVADARYPTIAPFHPGRPYPEYPFASRIGPEPNLVYDGVRRLLMDLGLDAAHADTPAWNPLGRLVEPGMTVVLKPNFVLSRHRAGKSLFAIVTHAAVLRAIADYCWIALGGRGRIVIADAPQYDCDFAELRAAAGLDALEAFYAGHPGPAVVVRDLRRYWSRARHFPSMVRPLPGDPEGAVRVDLGRESALYGRPTSQLYGAVYHRQELVRHHCGETHEYELAGTVMHADVVISVPKMKVHKKVGVTLNAKGLVGIATNKNMLVHYTLAPPSAGGDQYPDGHLTPTEARLIRTERWMYDHLLAPRWRPLEYLHRALYWLHGRLLKPLGLGVRPDKRLLDAGNWSGNDSAWRMVADLMTAFEFADATGRLRAARQRRTFSIVDGIVGGENQGPLVPDPKAAGVLVGGENLLAVDLVATRLMGFDPRRLKMYAHLLTSGRDFGVRRPEDVAVVAADPAWRACLRDADARFLDFRPYPGWVEHLTMPARWERAG